ncbi:hypothetical protein WDU94_003819 [Cyamophila willieti]
MDILKAEIARKRKLLEDSKVITENKKYFKGSELRAKQEEEYNRKYGPKTEDTLEKNSTNDTDSSRYDGSLHQTLPRKEVIRRLRERGEPITLFGESELDSFQRLRQCEIQQPETNKGFRNDFQEALEKVDQTYLDELLASQAQTSNSRVIKEQEKPPEKQITYDDIQMMAKDLGKGDRNLDMNVTLNLIQFLLDKWGTELNTRSGAEKMGTRGKFALATYTQTQQYLKPLLRKLKSKTLPEDISDSLTEITKHILDRNYIAASDSYLEMAIGNAPWPIGVTMVGIHARTGREKIFSKNVAHVLNDETQRKYIQGLKRLMTKCQQFYPTDPSRCVEYVPDDI